MSLMERANEVTKIARDLMDAVESDFQQRWKGAMPDSWNWFSEFDLREVYVDRRARRITSAEDTKERDVIREERKPFDVEFSKVLAQCERLGLIQRHDVPGSTSMRLPHGGAAIRPGRAKTAH